ncbi:MAG: FG-GAP-like repeat-containing protein [Candidatus Thermoplasmatota archaeon]|nr:FG-GAP-like repeat-containing protein [Candidatus Thermoplasmatota archaeon]
MKRVLVLTLLVILSTVSLTALTIENGSGEVTNVLYDDTTKEGLDGKVIDIPLEGGSDSNLYFKVGMNVPISDAHLNISTHMIDQGTATTEPYVDVGLDNRLEWMYSGTGYGKFGDQKSFSDGLLRKSFTFSSGASNNEGKVLLPRNAELISADMDMRGRFRSTSVSNYQIEKDPATISLNGHSVKEGDMNGDGYLDVVLSDTRNSRIIWLENPDGSSTGDWTLHLVYSGYYASNCYSLDVGDIDGDGDFDIAATSYSSYAVSWFRNDNAGSTWIRCTFFTSFYYAGMVKIADMDKDGNPDLVVCSYFYYYYYYNYPFVQLFKAPDNPMYNGTVNPGGSSSAWTNYKVAGVSSNYYYEYTYFAFDVGDLNNDSYPDIVIAITPQYSPTYYANQLMRFLNPKTLSTSTWSSQSIDSSHNDVRTINILDITGDGLNDILAGAYAGNMINVYENSNTNKGSSWTKRGLVSVSNPFFMRTKDFNGDNKTDIMVGGGSGIYEFGIYTQGSSYTSWTKNSVTNAVIDPIAFAMLDFDKDNDLDFMVAGTTGSQLIIAQTLSKSPATFNIRWLADGGVKDVRDIDFTDLDDDGDTDMVLCAYGTGWVGWWENDGTPFDGVGGLFRIGALGNAIKIMFADVDGDGDKDVVSLSSSRILYWWENTGTLKGSWPGRQIANNIDSPYGMYAGDFTGDGKADVVTSSYVGYTNCYVRLFKSPTNPKTAGNWQYNNLATGLSYLKNCWADDMNLDGDLDVLIVYGAYGSGSGAILTNPLGSKDPMSGTWSATSIDSSLYYPEDIKSIDITDDGYPDVVLTGSYYYSQVFWYQSPLGKQVSSWEKRSIDTFQYSWNLEVGDIGGDGYADILLNQGSYSSPTALFWYEEPVDYTSSWAKTSLGSHSGTWGLGIADLEGDEVEELISTSRSLDEVRAWKINAAFPSNVGLDVGDDETSNDWYNSGTLKGKRSVDIKKALQDTIDAEPSGVIITPDKYGTEMMLIPFQISTGTAGRVQMENIRITYEATVTIDQDGKGNPLSKTLDRLIPDYTSETEDHMRIYVLVGAESKGMLYVDSLHVEYNAIPKQINKLPPIAVDEETITILPFDLEDYFRDDYTGSKDLIYSLKLSGSNANKISAKVVENKIVIDTTITKDFYSRSSEPYDIYGRLQVTDSGGPNNVPSRTLTLKEFPIIVRNVNDLPRNTGDRLPTLYAWEGEETVIVDLDDHHLFMDVDGDPIQLHLEPRFGPTYNETADFKISWSKSTNELTVSLSESSDWTGKVEVRMYAYDLILVPSLNSRVDFIVEVVNINDPIAWSSDIPVLEIDEDSSHSRAMELTQYVLDIDTSRGDIEIDIIRQTNTSFYWVGLEYLDNDLVYIAMAPRIENWFGSIDLTLSASDGEFSSEVKMKVQVIPVNDPPVITITEPIENGRVGGSEFSIIGEAFDVEGIQWVEILFEGEWYRPTATYSWGYTLKTPSYSELTEDVPLQVRVYDGAEYAYAYVNITVLPYSPVVDPDYDDDSIPNNMDKFPYDPSESKDSDRDGVGDNKDEFPFSAIWWQDFDKDGYADQADTHPNDPERWNDKNDDGRNDDLPPPPPRETKTEQKNDSMIVAVLYVLAVLALLAVILSSYLFMVKLRASKDPRKMAKFYNRQQKWRLRRHELMEKLPLASMIYEPASKGSVNPTMSAGSPYHGFKPAPAKAPMHSPLPQMHRPSLPPVKGPPGNI